MTNILAMEKSIFKALFIDKSIPPSVTNTTDNIKFLFILILKIIDDIIIVAVVSKALSKATVLALRCFNDSATKIVANISHITMPDIKGSSFF